MEKIKHISYTYTIRLLLRHFHLCLTSSLVTFWSYILKVIFTTHRCFDFNLNTLTLEVQLLVLYINIEEICCVSVDVKTILKYISIMCTLESAHGSALYTVNNGIYSKHYDI